MFMFGDDGGVTFSRDFSTPKPDTGADADGGDPGRMRAEGGDTWSSRSTDVEFNSVGPSRTSVIKGTNA